MTEGGQKGPELPEFDERAPILVGIAIWVVLLVLSLAFRPHLVDDGHGWWVWASVAGIGQGLFGFWFANRRRGRLRAGA